MQHKNINVVLYSPVDQNPMNSREAMEAEHLLTGNTSIEPFNALMIVGTYKEKGWSFDRFKETYRSAMGRAKYPSDIIRYLLNPVAGIKLYDYQAYCVMSSSGVKLDHVKIDGNDYFVRPEDKKYFE